MYKTASEILSRPFGYQYFNILKDHLGRDLSKVFNGDIVYPRQVEIHLPANHITPCNFSCYYCQGRLLDQPVDVHFEQDALELMHKLTGKIAYYIFGGAYSEPLLNPYLLKFLETSKACGASFGIHTNGSLLHQLNKTQDFLSRLCSISTHVEDYLSVSLDAGDRETHKKTKNTDRYWFDEIIEGIREVTKIRGEKDCPAIRVCYLLNKQNSSLKELNSVISIMRDIGVDSLKFSIPYDLYGKDFSRVREYKQRVELPCDKKYKEELFQLLLGRQGDKPHIFYIPPESQDVESMKFSQCIYSYYQITLGADGYAYKCSSTATPTFKMNRLGKITSDLEKFNRMVLANHNPKFKPCTCFKVGARCNRMALEVNKAWEKLHNE